MKHHDEISLWVSLFIEKRMLRLTSVTLVHDSALAVRDLKSSRRVGDPITANFGLRLATANHKRYEKKSGQLF